MQLQCEMKACNCQKLPFTLGSEKSTKVFRVSFDESLWKATWNLLYDMYGQHYPKRQLLFPKSIKNIKSKVQTSLN